LKAAGAKAVENLELLKMAAKAGFNAIVISGSVSGSYQNVTNKEAFDSDKVDNLVTQGGAFALNISQLQTDPLARTKWESTLEDQGTLVDFGTTTTRALVPIWELCDDFSRAVALKAEFEELNKAEGNKWPVEKYVTDIVFLTDPIGNDSNTIKSNVPPGYILVDVDLNPGYQKRDGYYSPYGGRIYMAYLLGDNPNNAITDLFMEYSTVKKEPETKKTTHNGHYATYWRLPGDLNLNAPAPKKDRDNFIYLWATKDKTLPPIKEIQIVLEDPDMEYTSLNNVCWQNSKEPADANRGTGDTQSVYIKFHR